MQVHPLASRPGDDEAPREGNAGFIIEGAIVGFQSDLCNGLNSPEVRFHNDTRGVETFKKLARLDFFRGDSFAGTSSI